ncbi:hypothetical protein [Streptomyces sp. c-19]|uniref:hypothetical protein n=1 Tax=Streptomyces sp. c-19 TaxID=2789275 RepID=UPI00397ED921
MISEPELVGGVVFDAPEVLTEEKAARPPRPPRARRPWLWALGGAVLASAVWGGGLYAYERGEEPGPDLGGYKSVSGLCRLAELPALSAVLGERSADGEGPVTDDPAVLRVACPIRFGPPESGYSGWLSYTLHKVTDPGPEFDAQAKSADLHTPIDGLGEKAFFSDREGEAGELMVLDGQAEIALAVSRDYSVDAEGNETGNTEPIDLSGIEVPMTQDMLALMAALKK